MAKFIRPTLDTKFHIDFHWWQDKRQNLKAFLQTHVCPTCAAEAEELGDETFDWVSPDTGEVFQINVLWHLIHTQCQHDPDFMDSRAPLTTAIFRAFIANNNQPLTPVEIYDRIQKKSPDMILRTIGGRQIYKGIKPVGYSD